jgi:PA domain
MPLHRHSVAVLFLLAAPTAHGADILVLNSNAPGQGFNDATAASPVGLNFGVTRGQQALIALQYAATVWDATLKSSVPIVVDSAFVTPAEDGRFVCSSTAGILGITGVAAFFTAEGLPVPGAGYPVALANALLGKDLTPGEAHIISRFNASVGTSGCLTNQTFYYGLDGKPAASQDDVVSVFLHEFAHGLGFLSAVDASTGAFGNGQPSIFDFHVYDVATSTPWQSENDARREMAAETVGGLALEGPALSAALPDFLAFPPTFSVDVPGVSNPVPFAAALFSGPFPLAGAPLVAAEPLDACAELTNASLLAGNIALIERTIPDGGAACRFIDKANRAQDAGASGVIFFNYLPDAGLFSPSGSPALDIPVGLVTLETGTAILRQTGLTPVEGSFGHTALRSGVDASGQRLLLYTPSTVVSASSVSHFGTTPTPALLMEPTISPSLLNQLDVTPAVLADLGWSVVQGLSVVVAKALEQQVLPGQEASYLLTLVNRREGQANDVSLDVTLPEGASILSTQGACAGGFPCALGVVPPGAVLLSVVTLHVPNTAAQPFSVAVAVSSSNPSPEDVLTSTVTLPSVSASGCTTGTGGPTPLWLGLCALVLISLRRHG